MPDLSFQLVFQFDATTNEDFSTLMDLMHDIEIHLAKESEAFVDCNDFGKGEFTIFIHTNEPVRIFDRTGKFVRSRRPTLAFSAGYRAFTDDKCTSLFPLGDQTFTVL